MKLRAIRMRDVRKFGPDGIAIEGIGNGLSVLAEPNEFGKSTLFDAMRAALFYKHSTSGQAIRALAPRSGGGAPHVELDIEIDGKLYRIVKRFLKKSMAEVHDLADGTIIARDGVAHDWIIDVLGSNKPQEGPAGLLWVEQGRSMDQPDGGNIGGALLSDVLEREIGQMVGGDRARKYLEEARRRLGVLITPGKRRPSGPFKRALDAQEGAFERFRLLNEKLASSEKVLREFGSAKDALASLNDPTTNRETQRKLKVAESELIQARQAASQLETLTERAESTRLSADVATQEYERLSLAQEEAGGLKTRLDEIDKALVTARSRFSETAAMIDETRDALEFAKVESDRAEIAESDARRATEAKDALKTLKELEIKFEKAKTLSVDVQDKTAERDQNLVTEEVRKAIDKLSRKQLITKAELEAGRPRLRVELGASGKGKVRINDEILIHGDDLTIAGTTRIDIAGIGTLTLDSADIAEAAQAFENADSDMISGLRKVGAKNIDEVQSLALQRNNLTARIEDISRQLTDLAPDGIEQLEGKMAAVRQISKLPVNTQIDPKTARKELDEAREQIEKARDAHNAATGAGSVAQAEIGRLEAEKGPQDSRYKALLDEIGDKPSWKKAITSTRKAIDTSMAVAKNAADMLDEALKSTPNIRMAEHKVERLQESQGNTEKHRRKLIEDTARLREQLNFAESEGLGERLADAEAELETKNHAVAAYKADIDALTLLIDTLHAAQQGLQEVFFQPVVDQIQPLLHIVLPDAKIQLGDGFQAETLKRGISAETIESLSGGTREQIAVLTRLAFAQLLSRQGKAVPIIFDDALVFGDDQRLEAMFTALHAATEDIQCILLTCHEKAFRDIGGQRLSWTKWPG